MHIYRSPAIAKDRLVLNRFQARRGRWCLVSTWEICNGVIHLMGEIILLSIGGTMTLFDKATAVVGKRFYLYLKS